MESFKNTKECPNTVALQENVCFHSTILTPMFMQYNLYRTFGECMFLQTDQLEIFTNKFF